MSTEISASADRTIISFKDGAFLLCNQDSVPFIELKHHPVV